MTLKLIELRSRKPLPDFTPLVMRENVKAIMRRAILARAGIAADPRLRALWFPGQGEFLEFLEVLNAAELRQVADCTVNLFGFNFRRKDVNGSANLDLEPRNAIERECAAESFHSMVVRADALRESFQSGCEAFSMSRADARWLLKFSKEELRVLALNCSMALVPTVSNDYYLAAITLATTGARSRRAAESHHGPEFTGAWR